MPGGDAGWRGGRARRRRAAGGSRVGEPSSSAPRARSLVPTHGVARIRRPTRTWPAHRWPGHNGRAWSRRAVPPVRGHEDARRHVGDATRSSARRTTLDDIDDSTTLEVDPDPDLLEPPTQAWRARTAIEMVISGALGLLASFVLSIDALKLAADPDADARLQPQLGDQLRHGRARAGRRHLLGLPQRVPRHRRRGRRHHGRRGDPRRRASSRAGSCSARRRSTRSASCSRGGCSSRRTSSSGAVPVVPAHHGHDDARVGRADPR